MLTCELKRDKEGLLYIEDDKILTRSPLLIDHRNNCFDRYYENGFYRLYNSLDYIIKYSYTVFAKKEIKAIKAMLSNLIMKQKNVSTVDFPIAYFRKDKELSGLVIKYYQYGVSFDSILEKEDIEELGKYYYHDEDSIHNLIILLEDVLNSLYEMFDNNIYYVDTNPGNLILTNNQVKIIDFDHRYVFFDNKDKRLASIMYTYVLLLNYVVSKYHLLNGVNETLKDFEDAKKYVKKLENNIRRG